MTTYKLNKSQAKRLIEGKPVVDGRGRKYIAGDSLKNTLEIIINEDRFDNYNITICNGEISILPVH